MRFCVTCIYWILLLISVVSSGLLFLIVASETAWTSSQDGSSDDSQTFVEYDNATVDIVKAGTLEQSGLPGSETEVSLASRGNYKEGDNAEEETLISASFESIIGEEPKRDKSLNIFPKSISQQPNLSQGISETGQAVILTLVDTTANPESKNQAEPTLVPEFHAKSTSKNSTEELLANGVVQPEGIAPAAVIERVANDTEELSEGEILLVEKSVVEETPEAVVVVRAEQKVTSDFLEPRLDVDTVTEYDDEVVLDKRPEEALTPASELNDTAARARLVSGTPDDGATAAVILDGIVTAGPTDPHEDIPSFSEWAQKRLEEAEKKKTHPNASVQNPGGPARGVGGMKVRSKNYASPDCGAKVVAANPEARSARSVLASTRDEYMLNTCTSRIWFVVELCEAIQAKKIELANFELFSSSPKDFSVFVSDRFPTREWSPVGQFTAKDTKDTQSFTLHPHLFGKFIKVELHSHYGSEHFCPISLFRAYGTSEFEVLETETENQALRETTPEVDDNEDSDEEELLDVESGEPPRNLFGSARDAVLSIVKKAAEVLVKSSDLTGNNITQIQQSIDSGSILENSYGTCSTPRYTILCGNCSDQKFAKVFQLVSCRERQLNQLLKIDFVNDTLRRGRLCRLHGVEIGKDEENELEVLDDSVAIAEDTSKFHAVRNLQATFLTSVFKPEYIVALCNVLATKERRVVMNTSNEVPPSNLEDAAKDDALSSKNSMPVHNVEVAGSPHYISSSSTSEPASPVRRSSSSKEVKQRTQEAASQETEDTTTASIENSSGIESPASQTGSAKILNKEDVRKESPIPVAEPSKEPTEETVQAEVLIPVPSFTNITKPPAAKTLEEPPTLGTFVEPASQTITSVPVITPDIQGPTNDSGTGPVTDNFEAGQSKPEKIQQLDQETKPEGKSESGEQEAKLSAQDPLSLDSLLSDLKDFESDTAHLQNGQSVSASSATQPATSAMPQKESVFLRLSNRIKTLERNMSLSGQYLEELSRRYKKQVEEMQRSLERAISAMGEESRKGDERDLKRLEEIAALREEILLLSKSVESLLYDRDSWRAKLSFVGQHALFICLEVTIVVFVLFYCRQSTLEPKKKGSKTVKGVVRRKSAENFGTTKKTKKRRPSEIASHITGTYRGLMIEEKCQEGKKEKKRKRKRETVVSNKPGDTSETNRDTLRYRSVLDVIPGGTTLPSRRASSIDPPKTHEFRIDCYCRRPESAPETNIGWPGDHLLREDRIMRLSAENVQVDCEKEPDINHRTEDSSSDSSLICIPTDTLERSNATEKSSEPKEISSKGSGILKTTRLSSPSFMKTALATRKKRKISSSEETLDSRITSLSESSRQPSPSTLIALPEAVGSVNGTATNGLRDESDESRSSTATPTTAGKKEKRSLKKMVRKFF